MIPIGCSVEALGTRLDMRFIEIKVINCIDPQNCLVNYLDPVLLEQTRSGDAKHKTNFLSPYRNTLGITSGSVVQRLSERSKNNPYRSIH